VCVCVCVYRQRERERARERERERESNSCFHSNTIALAIVNSASMNSGCRCLFELEFSPDVCLGMGFMDHVVTLFLAF